LGRWFQQLTPLFLIGLALLVWFEKVLPGHEKFTANFGDTFVLRVAVGFLSLYTLLLWGERERMQASYVQLLKTMRQFLERQRGEPVAPKARERLEAVRLLIAALGSEDAEVRASSRQHLARLVGQDLGEAPGPWQQWLAKAEQQGDGKP
jgi:hypothetical protein